MIIILRGRKPVIPPFLGTLQGITLKLWRFYDWADLAEVLDGHFREALKLYLMFLVFFFLNFLSLGTYKSKEYTFELYF